MKADSPGCGLAILGVSGRGISEVERVESVWVSVDLFTELASDGVSFPRLEVAFSNMVMAHLNSWESITQSGEYRSSRPALLP